MKPIEKTFFLYFGTIVNFLEDGNEYDLDRKDIKNNISRQLSEITDTVCLVKELQLNKEKNQIKFKVMYVDENDNIKIYDREITRDLDSTTFSNIISSAIDMGASVISGENNVNINNQGIVTKEKIVDVNLIDPDTVSNNDLMNDTAKIVHQRLENECNIEIGSHEFLPTIFVLMMEEMSKIILDSLPNNRNLVLFGCEKDQINVTSDTNVALKITNL